MDKRKKDAFAGPECANCTATKTKAGQPLSQKCARCRLLVYCSRECQVQHWKSGGHQKWCLTPKERSVQQSALAQKEEVHEATLDLDCEASCPVCLEPIVLAKTDLNVTLACSHLFHIACVEGLRSYALQQACPLCRAELRSESGTSTTTHCANCGNEKCSNGALPSSVVPIVNLYYIVDETAKDLIGNMVATRLSARRQRLSGSRLHSINH